METEAVLCTMQIVIHKICGPILYVTNKFPANANNASPQTEPASWGR